MRKIMWWALVWGSMGLAQSAEYAYVPLVRDGAEWGYS